DITGFGGLCRWSGYPTARERSIIAWGGVLAQAAVFAVATSVVAVLGWPHGLLGQLANVLIRTNAWLMLINLLPFPPLDGAEAWALFSRGGLSLRPVTDFARRAWSRLRAPRSREARPVTPSAGRVSSNDARDLAELMRRIRDDARTARTRPN